jgi:hypothetical protein
VSPLLKGAVAHVNSDHFTISSLSNCFRTDSVADMWGLRVVRRGGLIWGYGIWDMGYRIWDKKHVGYTLWFMIYG